VSDNPFAAVVEPLSPDDNSVVARLTRLELWKVDIEARLARAEHPPLMIGAPQQEAA
jgi:hypothetical protein